MASGLQLSTLSSLADERTLMFTASRGIDRQSEGAALQPKGQRFVKNIGSQATFAWSEGKKMRSKTLSLAKLVLSCLSHFDAKVFCTWDGDPAIRFAHIPLFFYRNFNFTSDGLQSGADLTGAALTNASLVTSRRGQEDEEPRAITDF